MVSHAVAGGVMEAQQGGAFAHGSISAGVTKYVMHNGSNRWSEKGIGHVLARTPVAGAVVGTVSQITGGKFVNGARTAAYAHLLSQETRNVPGAIANAHKGRNGFFSKLKRAFDIDKIGELQSRAKVTDEPHEVG